MKTKLSRLALAAMLLTGSSMVQANDGSSVVGDLPGYGEDAYFGEDAAYTETQTYDDDEYDNEPGQEASPVSHHQPTEARATTPQRQFAPVPANNLQAVSHQYEAIGSACATGNCGQPTMTYSDPGCGCNAASCDGGCDSSCGGDVYGIFDKCDSGGWAQMDTLLWFVQDRNTHPYILSAPAGVLPVDGAAGVQRVFGGDIAGELSAGFRADVGTWLSDDVGIGGRFWGLADNNDSYFFSGSGNQQSIGRSFFNTNLGIEDAVVIATTGSPLGPDLTGSVYGHDNLEMWAAEAYARFRFASTKSTRLDFIGGYSHFNIDNDLSIGSSTTITGVGGGLGGASIGDQFAYLDQFSTDNEFNGGQVGFEMVMNRGQWTVRSLTKVHLGNMDQTFRSSGTSTLTPAGGAANTTSGGILAGSTPQDISQSTFAFAPEANFKLGYQFRPNVTLNVGYSFIYFDNVAMAGDMIDRNVDGTTIGNGTNNNPVVPNDSSLFVQGVDLGFTVAF